MAMPGWTCPECTWEHKDFSVRECDGCGTLCGRGLVASAVTSPAPVPSAAEKLCVVAGAQPEACSSRCGVCGVPSAGSALCKDCSEAKRADEQAEQKLEERRKAKAQLAAEVTKEMQVANECARKVARERAALVAKLHADACTAVEPTSRPLFYIVCSCDDWVPHEMLWNEAQQCYLSTLQLGSEGFAKFQILVDGDSQKRMYPCVQEAPFQSDSAICGPDEQGEGKVWTIGRHQIDKGVGGDYYEVRVHMDANGKVEKVNWAKIRAITAAPFSVARKYFVRGTWDAEAAHEMNWDPVRCCFHYNMAVGSKGRESFKILVNNLWHQSLYPDADDGHFHLHPMCGPDSLAGDCRWTIGMHDLDADAAGAHYEIRLRVTTTGKAQDVNWVRLSKPAGKTVMLATTSAKASLAVRSDAPCAFDDEEAEEEPIHVASNEDAQNPRDSSVDISVQETREQLAAELTRGLRDPASKVCAAEASFETWDTDSDGEELVLCQHCGLPLPEFAYNQGGAKQFALMHGECMAEVVVDDFRQDDRERLEGEAALKQAKRKEYDIGWKFDRIPQSSAVLSKLNCASPSDGMCCLVLDEQTRTVRPAPTADPAEAVNFAYLSLALQVRLREDREPRFSLDPIDDMHDVMARVDAEKRDAWMQVKRFEPAWLSGTSLGEAMFQADYHLKELSMGEYEQPVVGMKSAHDIIEMDKDDKEWCAREWFVVKKASVQLSDEGVLIPRVKMGVEAREQVRDGNRVEDAKITRPDHPLVKYAESFTENFDLIAERKSVIYHLREVAKASTMAKFFLEAKVLMEDSWYSMADTEMAPCIMEVPQLWNERCHSQVSVQNGKLEDKAMDPASAASTVALRCAGLAFEGAPQGVDLNLDEFNLSEVTAAEPQAKVGSWAGGAERAWGCGFWPQLEEAEAAGSTALAGEDRDLLRAVFNPRLSDRREEGDLFVPPDAGFAYVQRLRKLVRQEEIVRQQ
eukprot:CAMPEP_0115566520 /NCGR_PEP_ID=MMETSP0271-20121206/103624_1 /TAXON_ID=71861 /ORGANISM="Scrippsiella trochoidea, Strain CCMP3099" /LENGTH=972 /DNA_ID=CAMNT_0003000825 /DNA_START=22 /DNA_END=2938 /DNA_ORIENTATION=-